MNGLIYLRHYLRRHLGTLLVGFLLIIIANLLALTLPYVTGLAVDDIQANGNISHTGHFALILVGLALITGCAQLGARFVVNAVSREIEYELRNDLFQQFQRLELDYFQRRRLGDLVARAINDLSAIRMMLGPGINNSLNTATALLATLVVMFQIDAQLMLYTTVMLPLMTITFFILDKRISRSFKRVQDQFGIVSAQAQENFSGIRVVKAYTQEDAELGEFNRVNGEYMRRSLIYARFYSVLWPAMFFISGVAAAVLLWRGGLDVIAGRINLGQLVQFNIYLAQLTWPMIALGWVVNLFQQGQASLVRVREVLEYTPAIADGPQTNPAARVSQGAVTLRHVTLRYADATRDALHDISVTIPPGGSLGIVGATGAGKSSLVNLITRTFEPQSGEILIDDQPIQTISLDVLHGAIGYVPQESFLFSTSIADNIGYGKLDATPDELNRAAEIAQLSKDVVDFPNGIFTVVGERGVSLSGGQKQRTSIARAVAQDPQILILDDALSSVDTNTEAEILRRLRDFMRNRTAIVIAHRISTVKDLDQIIVLDDGRIVEHGTHDALLRLGGIYHAMYRRQLLGEELALDGDGATAPTFAQEQLSQE
jgi:ATP-binding cassette subfamily B multidrug efflux pump